MSVWVPTKNVFEFVKRGSATDSTHSTAVFIGKCCSFKHSPQRQPLRQAPGTSSRSKRRGANPCNESFIFRFSLLHARNTFYYWVIIIRMFAAEFKPNPELRHTLLLCGTLSYSPRSGCFSLSLNCISRLQVSTVTALVRPARCQQYVYEWRCLPLLDPLDCRCSRPEPP